MRKRMWEPELQDHGRGSAHSPIGVSSWGNLVLSLYLLSGDQQVWPVWQMFSHYLPDPRGLFGKLSVHFQESLDSGLGKSYGPSK